MKVLFAVLISIDIQENASVLRIFRQSVAGSESVHQKPDSTAVSDIVGGYHRRLSLSCLSDQSAGAAVPRNPQKHFGILCLIGLGLSSPYLSVFAPDPLRLYACLLYPSDAPC